MIVVFGSVNLDLVTEVARIPQPGETVIGPGFVMVAGGKGANQAVAAARAGARTCFVGSIGGDEFGELATTAMREADIDLRALATREGSTGLAFITVDAEGENAIVVAAGANLLTDADQFHAVDAPAGAFLLLQREIADTALLGAVRVAKGRGWRVMLNAAPAGPVPDEVLRSIEFLLVNEHEARIVADAAGLKASEPEDAVRELHRAYGCSVVMTLGPRGAAAFVGGERLSASALEVTAVDTTAAGDSFAGAFAAALAAGSTIAAALRDGVAAGSLACTIKGAQDSIPNRAMIDQALAFP